MKIIPEKLAVSTIAACFWQGFLNCNFLFYPIHSIIKLKNPFRDYLIQRLHFIGGPIGCAFETELESEPRQIPGPSTIFWASHKSFPTELHCHHNPLTHTATPFSLSLCQEVILYISQALGSYIYFHFQRVTSTLLDWFSSLLYSQFLCSTIFLKGTKDKGHLFLNCIPQSSQAYLYVFGVSSHFSYKKGHISTQKPHSGSRRAHKALDLALIHL